MGFVSQLVLRGAVSSAREDGQGDGSCSKFDRPHQQLPCQILPREASAAQRLRSKRLIASSRISTAVDDWTWTLQHFGAEGLQRGIEAREGLQTQSWANHAMRQQATIKLQFGLVGRLACGGLRQWEILEPPKSPSQALDPPAVDTLWTEKPKKKRGNARCCRKNGSWSSALARLPVPSSVASDGGGARAWASGWPVQWSAFSWSPF